MFLLYLIINKTNKNLVCLLPYQGNFRWGKFLVKENIPHLSKIWPLLPDGKTYFCFRNLQLEFKNLRFQINIFNIAIINYKQNFIFSLQQLSCCLVTFTGGTMVI